MTTTVPEWAAEAAAAIPRPLLFATVSGAHLYGFPSADSDLDIRAAHLLPATENVLGAELPYVSDLIATKREAEHGPFPAAAKEALLHDLPRLRAELEAARDASHLPERPRPEAVDALHDLVVRTRLA